VQRAALLLIAAVLVLPGAGLRAEPPAKNNRSSSAAQKTTDRGPTRGQIIESAHGWTYVKGEWVHPDGYKFVNNKIVRTTAKAGKRSPQPPGKLALENPAQLVPATKTTAPPPKNDTKTAAEKAAEERRKNLEPRPASQTGSHL
jgi:hypothetical protein